MMGQKLTQRELEIIASKLLGKQGFCADGRPRTSQNRGQLFFEQRIIKTPMGNQMR
jgi:hypothetical protein